MGIFSSARNAICSVLDTTTDIADTAGKAVSMATTYVDNRAIMFEDTDMTVAATNAAKKQAELKRELEADEDAAAIYSDLIKQLEARKAQRHNR